MKTWPADSPIKDIRVKILSADHCRIVNQIPSRRIALASLHDTQGFLGPHDDVLSNLIAGLQGYLIESRSNILKVCKLGQNRNEIKKLSALPVLVPAFR